MSLLASSFLTSFSWQFPDITFHNSFALFLRQKAKLGAKPTEHMPNAEGEVLFHLLHAFVAKVVYFKTSQHTLCRHARVHTPVCGKEAPRLCISFFDTCHWCHFKKTSSIYSLFSSSHVHKVLLWDTINPRRQWMSSYCYVPHLVIDKQSLH